MTGFGRAQHVSDGIQCSVEISSVNRKNLDIQVHLPRERSGLEPAVVRILRDRLARGRIQVRICIEAEGQACQKYDADRLAASLNQVNELAEELGVRGVESVRELFAVPGVQIFASEVDDSSILTELVSRTVEDAANALIGMRETEGQALQTVLERMHSKMSCLVEGLQGRAGISLEQVREKLLGGLKAVGVEGLAEDQRLLQEIAFYGERADVTEEADRLSSHLQQLSEKLVEIGPVGRALDFLGQEIAREVNTICSKSQDIELTRDALAMKELVDQFREQCLNVE